MVGNNGLVMVNLSILVVMQVFVRTSVNSRLFSIMGTVSLKCPMTVISLNYDN